MAAVTGAIWKCATNNTPNVERFQELELMNILIQLLRDNSDALDDLQFKFEYPFFNSLAVLI